MSWCLIMVRIWVEHEQLYLMPILILLRKGITKEEEEMEQGKSTASYLPLPADVHRSVFNNQRHDYIDKSDGLG